MSQKVFAAFELPFIALALSAANPFTNTVTSVHCETPGGVLMSGEVPALRLHGDRFEWRWSIPLVGVLLAAADWLYFTGLAIPDVPISVASLMRRFSVVLTFVFGARFFHETNLRRKALALRQTTARSARRQRRRRHRRARRWRSRICVGHGSRFML